MNGNNYRPQPIDASMVVLPPEVEELTEKLSCNAHEIWARQRLTDGWRWGEARDDVHKLHPCLIPYDELPEAERIYDRATAMETVKAILALGFCISRRENQ
jgi:hypothetical protein